MEQTAEALAFWPWSRDLGWVRSRGEVIACSLVLGCSLNTFSDGRGSAGLGPEDETTAGEPTKGEEPTKTGSATAADGDGGSGSEMPPDPSGDPPMPTTLPPGDPSGDGSTTDPDQTGTTSTGSDSGPIDDCSTPSTFNIDVNEAGVVEPMQKVNVPGVGVVGVSYEEDEGEIEFTVDIACPGPYFMHAYVVDLWPGVHGCCDPDSYDVFWPGAGSANWFYGCQSAELSVDWRWLAVTHVDPSGQCDDQVPAQLELDLGENVITFHNREAAYNESVAAMANLVVTNDPDWSPE